MKKFLLSLALAVAVVAGMSAQTVVLEENFNLLETVNPETGAPIFGNSIAAGVDGQYQPNYGTYLEALNNGTLPMDYLNGWTARTIRMYPCFGFVRFGATQRGGDLISPKLTALTEPTDVEVTWKACGYSSTGGTYDYQAYCVSVLGAGEVEGASVQAKYLDAESNVIAIPAAIREVPADAYPNFEEENPLVCFNAEGAKASITIKNATAETQLVLFSTNVDSGAKENPLIGGDYPEMNDYGHATNVKCNRIHFDDFKFVVKSSAVTDVTAAKTVAGMRYYNLMGAESAEPFEGVCIVKTVYTDGTSTVAKVLR